MDAIDKRIPQADNLDLVLDLVLGISSGSVKTSGDAASLFGYAPRQGDYYRDAAEILGLAIREADKILLTTRGNALPTAPEVERPALLAEAVRNAWIIDVVFAVIARAGPNAIGPEDLPQIIDSVAKANGLTISGTTVRRRAQTVGKWLAWLHRHGAGIIITNGTYEVRLDNAEFGSNKKQLVRNQVQETQSPAATVTQAPGAELASAHVAIAAMPGRLDTNGHVPLPRLFAEISKDSKLSVISEGHLPSIMQRLYVRDSIDEQLDAWLSKPDGASLMILTGSAGHGKSAAIAQALEKAEALGIALDVRPDATHADSATETYEDGLVRFLAPFRDGAARPRRRGLLAMNLGLALRFFGKRDGSIQDWQGIAAALDQKFQLGLRIDVPPNQEVEFIDLSRRISLSTSNKLADIAFLSALLARFDANDPSTIVADSIAHECARCSAAPNCPILLNAQLLSDPVVRSNLSYAMASAAVKHDVHVTPRLIMDTLSHLVVHPDIRTAIDETMTECNLADDRVVSPRDGSEGKTWGRRLEQSLFANAFPPYEGPPETDRALLDAMRSEAPSAARSEHMDKAILKWTANAEALIEELHPLLRGYLAIDGTKALTPSTLTSLVSAHQWSHHGPLSRPEAKRLNDFVQLASGDAECASQWTPLLTDAIRRVATGAYHDQAARDGRAHMAIQMAGVASTYRILADLGTIETEIRPAEDTLPLSGTGFGLEIQVAAGLTFELWLDWRGFSFLADIAAGYSPRPSDPYQATFVRSLTRRLALGSNMTNKLVIEKSGASGALHLKMTGPRGSRTRMKAEVKY